MNSRPPTKTESAVVAAVLLCLAPLTGDPWGAGALGLGALLIIADQLVRHYRGQRSQSFGPEGGPPVDRHTRLRQLSALQQQRPLTAPELLEVAILLDEIGDHDQAVKARRRYERALAGGETLGAATSPVPGGLVQQSPGSGTSAGVASAICVLVLAALIYLPQILNSDPARPTPATPNDQRDAPGQIPPVAHNTAPALKVVEQSFVIDDGWGKVSGRVQNISDRPLRYVQVHISYYTSDDQFIESDWTYLSATELYPGQSSSFDEMLQVDGRYQGYRLSFESDGLVLYAKGPDD